MQYSSGELPDPNILWSPRVGFNWDVSGDQQHAGARRHRRLHRPARRTSGSRTRSATPACSPDSMRSTTPTTRPFNPDPDRYKPARRPGTGGQLRAGADRSGLQVPAAVAKQHRGGSPAARGLHRHGGVHLQQDVNGIYYINANLPAAQTAFAGVDARPRWTQQPNPRRHVVERHRSQEPERRPLLEHRGLGGEDRQRRALRSGAPTATARPRTRSIPGRSPSVRGTATRTPGDPNNPGCAHCAFGGSPAIASSRRRPTRKEYFGFGGDDGLDVLGSAGTTATPATCSPAT